MKQESSDEAVARPRLLTVAEAAKELRISTSFLYELIAKGKVPGVVRLGRVIRIDIDAILRGLHEGLPPHEHPFKGVSS